MTVKAASLVSRSDYKVIHKKRRCRKRVRRPAGTLQHLFHSCQAAFKGPGTVPCATHVQNLCRILDCMKPEDVGLSKDLHFFKRNTQIDRHPARVTSATIYKSDQFELCIFFVPENAVIPLHNHPEMTVFNKLLLGTMHVKAYDWVDLDPLTSKSPTKLLDVDGSCVRLAKVKANGRLAAPCDTSVLYPTSGGNIHEFTAITPCAVLDVIGPPYSKHDARDCTYYQLVSDFEIEEEDGYGWLKETEIPKESKMDRIEYMGPHININNPNPSST